MGYAKAERPPLVVLGADCLTGLQIARIAWRQGLEVLGVAYNPHSPYCRSRSYAQLFATEDFIAAPSQCLPPSSSGAPKPVALACTDDFAWWIEQHQAGLRSQLQLLFPAAGVMAKLADKRGFHEHATALGLPVPETWFVDSWEALAEQMAQLPFPLVLKPLHKSDGWESASGGQKALRVTDQESLQALAQPLLAHGTLIVQRWVEGPDADTREVSLCLDQEQNLIAAIALRKLRQWPTLTGTGSLAELVDAPELIETACRVLRPLPYAGPAQVEFKLERATGRYFLIEANAGRVALNFPLFEANGMEMTMRCYEAAQGHPAHPLATPRQPAAKWICWKRDLPAALTLWRRGELTLGEWRRSLGGPRRAADVDWSDPLPMLADFGSKLARRVTRAHR